MFELHPNLKKKDYITDLKLSTVLLEDNKDIPWIFLVPKKENVRNMLDLTHEERLNLMAEIEKAEKVMNALFKPDQTNVAMIGNLTPQLHVHIMARYKTDYAWPDTAWGKKGTPYTPKEKEEIILKIKKELEK